MSGQLPLSVGLRDGNTFDNFLLAANPGAFAAVRSLIAGDQPFVYLWGEPGTGRSHLLEAAVDAAATAGRRVAYVSARLLPTADITVLAGLGAAFDLVCLDDADHFGTDAAWNEALFHLFNQLRASGASLLMSASAPPAASAFRLPDLVSRLSSGLVVALHPLDDETRLAVLTLRAARRGLELPPETGRWLLARTSRRLADLVALLAVLDQAVLVHQRRLTVPFVRQVLAAPDAPDKSPRV